MHAVVTDNLSISHSLLASCASSSRYILSMADAHARDQRANRQHTREADTAVPIQPDSEGAGWQEDDCSMLSSTL